MCIYNSILHIKFLNIMFDRLKIFLGYLCNRIKFVLIIFYAFLYFI